MWFPLLYAKKTLVSKETRLDGAAFVVVALLQEARRVFDLYDINHDGGLAGHELFMCFMGNGVPLLGVALNHWWSQC